MKLNVPRWAWSVVQTLTSHGYSAYFVGGCVRNHYLGIPVNDYDVATNAHPTSVQKLFPHTLETGLQHGTVTVCVGPKQHVEVTTFRTESPYTDGRRPDAVRFTENILEDLRRRDFTMNAVAVGHDGKWIDPHDGRGDMDKRFIRAVGDAHQRFHEDALRVLRALRFAAQLGFQIENATKSAMKNAAQNLTKVSSERIGIELRRIACSRWTDVATSFATDPWLDYFPSPWPQMRQGFKEFIAFPYARQQSFFANLLDTETGLERAVRSFAVWLVLAAKSFDGKWIDTHALKLYRSIAWPIQEGKMSIKTVDIVRSNPASWTNDVWYQSLFKSGSNTVLRGCLILDWINDTSPLLMQTFEQLTKTQPLWSVSDLALSGQKLIQLGATGAMIGRIKNRLIGDILCGRTHNDEFELECCAKKYIKEELQDE